MFRSSRTRSRVVDPGEMRLDSVGVVWHHRGAVLHPPYPVHRTIESPLEYRRTLAEIQVLIDLSVRRTREEDELLERLLELARGYRRRRRD